MYMYMYMYVHCVLKIIGFNLMSLLFLGIERMREEREQQEIKNKESEDAYRIKKGTYDLLPQADENIAKLKVAKIRNV